jgi:mycothiol synthase
MRQYLSQPSYRAEENAFVAESGDHLAGFTVVSPELPLGRSVASGGVPVSDRNRGIGRLLVRKSVEHSRSLGAGILHVQISSDDAVAQRLFRSEGFHKIRSYWSMRRDADSFEAAPMASGYSIRPFVLDRDEESLTRLQNASFADSWGFCPNTTEEIRARVRLRWSFPDGILMLNDGERPAAYNWTLRPRKDGASVGWIAMTGVHPDYRGQGLGEAVIGAGMALLKNRGVRHIDLEVDSANSAARGLYLKLGFKKVGETTWFEKDLTGS